MKKIMTLLFGLGVMIASAQSTDGWKPIFEEGFSNNANGWSLNETSNNTSKISYNNQRLVLQVNDNGSRRSTVYTRVDFNEDFMLKCKIGAETEARENNNEPTEYGVYFGYSSFAYKGEQGWYAVKLNYHRDEVWIAANNANGTKLFEKTVTDVSYDSEGMTEVGIMNDGGTISFYINGTKVYENVATTTFGGAISFIAERKQKAFMSEINIYEKDIPPTPEEIAEEEALEEALPDADEQVIIDAVSNLEFASGRSTISESSITALNTMAEMMIRNTNFKVILKGHTDDVGDPAANLRLSQERVDSVIAYLVEAGIDAGRLSGLGYGDRVPIADNSTPEGRQMNRRVEFEIVLP